MTDSISAVSATVRAMGPVTLHGSHASGAGWTGTRPGEVRKPTTPQNAAGRRSEPPRSVPWASGPRPVASATAPPPVEPPGVSAGFQGLRVTPKPSLKVLAPAPNSGVLVLPSTMAPAAFRRATTSASSSGTWCSKILLPHVVPDALRRREVLDRHRHAVQRTEARAAPGRRRRLLRGRQRRG